MSTSRKSSAAAKKPAPRPAAPAPRTPAPAPAKSQAIGLDEIKSLIALVGREPFQEFEFEAGDMRFRIRKDGPVQAAPVVSHSVVSAPSPQVHAPVAAA